MSSEALASGVVGRPLDPSEWPAFRDLRLDALRTERWAYASTHDDEASTPPAEWEATIAGPDRQVFGLFDAGRLVGIAAVFAWREDPLGETAVFGMSFIRPEYRGRGLWKILNEMRLTWVAANGRFTSIVTGHRGRHHISAIVARGMGFSPIARVPRTWPDGTIDDRILYRLEIRSKSTVGA